ncbi:hypothetical protein H4219_002848 [Mycoemilia scoparia]|uniref:Uncharacterized protein n=1 Tax=Mycoemilia scoparia TaxID=417184 RepID=A0A9W8DTT8_9FUNG|nr:hypothetical protein H4219_002848 [Mycoemilia scoparia]
MIITFGGGHTRTFTSNGGGGGLGALGGLAGLLGGDDELADLFNNSNVTIQTTGNGGGGGGGNFNFFTGGGGGDGGNNGLGGLLQGLLGGNRNMSVHSTRGPGGAVHNISNSVNGLGSGGGTFGMSNDQLANIINFGLGMAGDGGGGNFNFFEGGGGLGTGTGGGGGPVNIIYGGG